MTSSAITHHTSLITHRAVFFDRDGVINEVILRDGQPVSPRRLEDFVFKDGIRDVVHQLKSAGYKVIVISNQPDLARGHITQEILDRMSQKMREEISIDDIFICPHDDHHQCSCRKPNPGMILQAAEKWGLDLKTSYFVGDTWKDMEAGKTAGCQTILVDAIYNREVHSDFRVKSLAEATSIILNT